MNLKARSNEANGLYLTGRPEDTRVVVAMSGGVDSSVVAGLLKQQGYDVVGITLQLYDHGEAIGLKGTCCAGQDIHDARRVAEKLGIPHYVLDYEKRFESAVMGQFADTYVAGETPVPCVTCNQEIKFRDLLETARDLGAEAMATGHYIQNRPGPDGWELYQGVDAERDQSYFLFGTTQEQLSQLRFPLGGLQKSETRALAEEFGLQVAQKSDSQDICFVPTGRYTQVIERLRPEAMTSGKIRHVDGHELGEHDGIINYTIGQRRGLGIAAHEPLYVVKLDPERHEVIVGPKAELLTNWLVLKELNWISEKKFADLPEEGLPLSAKIRSTQSQAPAVLHNFGGTPVVELCGGEYGVSPGQACVLYESDEHPARVLGGGWIEKTANERQGKSAILSMIEGNRVKKGHEEALVLESQQ